MKLIIGTRGSALALWQARYVAAAIERNAGVKTELTIIKTRGDKILDTPLAQSDRPKHASRFEATRIEQQRLFTERSGVFKLALLAKRERLVHQFDHWTH